MQLTKPVHSSLQLSGSRAVVCCGLKDNEISVVHLGALPPKVTAVQNSAASIETLLTWDDFGIVGYFLSSRSL